MQGSLKSGLHKRQWVDFQPTLDVWNTSAVLTSNCATTNASTTLTTTGTFIAGLGIWPGQTVTGSNIPAGCTVRSVQSATSLTLSVAATGTASGQTMTFGNVTPVLGPQADPSTACVGRYLYVPEMNLCKYDFSFQWGGIVIGPTATWVGGSTTLTTTGNFNNYGLQPGMLVFDAYPSASPALPVYTKIISIAANGLTLVMSQAPAATQSTATQVYFQGHGGAGYYLAKLPVPCRLQQGGVWGQSSPAIPDRFMGNGQAAQSGNEYPNVPCQYMPGDFNGLSYGGRRQDWTQAFCPYVRASGSVTTSSATTTTVNWPMALNSVPLAGHIQIGVTAALGSKTWYISNITQTGFTITWSAAFTGSFDWVLMIDNSLLVGSNTPFLVGTPYNGTNSIGSGDTWRGSLVYETES